MTHPKLIDKSVHAHAVLNMVAAVIQSPHGIPTAQVQAQQSGVTIDVAVTTLGEAFAMAALRNIESRDVIAMPAGSGITDALEIFADASGGAGRLEFEDTLQEGELGLNAAALLLNEPSYWTPDAQDGSEVPFPGSGADGGESRLNDLIRACCYVMAEIARVQRVLAKEDAFAAGADERGVAIMPEPTTH